jgi:hypothetical protein
MSAEQAGTPGRRLTEAEEARGAELFAAGLSERDVAAELGCSNSSAHRLRLRLEAAPDGAQDAPDARDEGSRFELTERRTPWPEGVDVITMRGIPRDGDDGEQDEPPPNEADAKAAAARVVALRELGVKRDELAEIVANHAARAQASREAIAALDRERLELLAASQDAAPLRPRRADAEADLADSNTAAALIAPQLAEVEAMIAGVHQEEFLAAQQAERARAVARGTMLAPKASAALRAAVTGDGTVRALADLGSQLAQAEAVAERSWDDEIVPPVLPGHPRDDWHRVVYDLWRAARRGDVPACQSVVPRCVPWQDRDPGEMERMRAEVAAHATRMQQMVHENAARLRQHTRGGASMLPELPNPLPGAVQTARTGW